MLEPVATAKGLLTPIKIIIFVLYFINVCDIIMSVERRWDKMIYRLKALRVVEGFNQTEFAKALGVTQTTVSAWETGRSIPSAENIKKIAEVLDKPTDDIFSLFNINKVIS